MTRKRDEMIGFSHTASANEQKVRADPHLITSDHKSFWA